MFLCAVLMVLFGVIPFSFGAATQAIYPRRLPAYVVGLLGAAAFIVLWRTTGWLPFRLGEGRLLWPSVIISFWLFVAFTGAGATTLRGMWPRRYAPKVAA
jgi:hypothetical protein